MSSYVVYAKYAVIIDCELLAFFFFFFFFGMFSYAVCAKDAVRLVIYISYVIVLLLLAFTEQ